MFEKNLELFKNQDLLYKKIKEGDYEKENNIEVFENLSKDNDKYMSIVIDEKEYVLNSKYSPLKEAEKFALQYKDLMEYTLVFVYGMANLKFIQEIKNLNSNMVNYIVYEPSINIFLYNLYNNDLKKIKEEKNIVFIVKSINEEELELYLDGCLDYLNRYNIKIVISPKYRIIFDKNIMEVRNKLIKNINNREINIVTTLRHSKNMVINSINNLKFVDKSISLIKFKDVFKDIEKFPAIIVGAGPSLQKNIKSLHKVKNKGLIIATDKSVQYLYNEKIVPDIVVTVDTAVSKKVGIDESLYLDEIFKDIVFIAPIDGSRYLINNIQKSGKIIFFNESSLGDIFENLFSIVDEKLPDIIAGGNVSNSALYIAYYLGFKDIILIGQDLAYSGGQLYMDTNKMSNEEMIKKGYIPLEGNIEEIVYTTPDFKLYHEFLEERIEDGIFKELNIVNATEGGAKIKGTKVMSFEETISIYCIREVDKKFILNSVESSFKTNFPKQNFYNYIFNMLDNFIIIKEKLVEINKYVKKYLIILNQKNYSVKEKEKLYKKVSKIGRELDEIPETIILMMYINRADLEYSKNLYKKEESIEKEHLNIVEKLEKLYGTMLEKIPEVINYMQETVDYIKNKENL